MLVSPLAPLASSRDPPQQRVVVSALQYAVHVLLWNLIFTVI